ncbi:unnamed protein product [Ilex paraguariensis]|uniref:Uncharacterized protein n=1 Tax=Ilex paraguariensis TaxID=185542 RepID=A0ABC8SCV3_9AQUA
MASETVVSDQSTTPEEVEKQVHEEVKTIEQEVVSPPKQCGEEEKPKAEDLPSPAVPLVAESEAKSEVKQVEPPVSEDVKKTDEEEKPKAGDSPSPAIPLVTPEDKIEDKQIEPSLIEEVKKTDAIPIVEVPVKDISKLAVESIHEQSTLAVSEPIADDSKSKPKEESVFKSVEKVEDDESTIKAGEEKPTELPKTVHVSESSVGAVEKKEEVEVLPVKEPEAVAVKTLESSEVATEKEEIPEPVLEAKEKPKEPSEVCEVQESSVVEPKESVEIDIAKHEETPADKVEDSKLLEEKITEEKPLVTKILDQASSMNQEAQVNPEEGEKVESPPMGAAEKGNVEEKVKELGEEAAVVEALSKEEVVEVEKFESESEAKNVKTEENGEKSVPTRELTQPETKEVEAVTPSISATEVTEKILEGENTSRDIELVAENGKETIKEETIASVETSKDPEDEEKVDEVTKTATEEPIEEPQKPEVETKGEESLQTGETKLEKEKGSDATTPRDVSILESAKDGDDTKTSPDPPKEEVSAKSTQKHSNSIISKVKQTLVKAKKAIIGKSPNSKTPPSETKGDAEAK